MLGFSNSVVTVPGRANARMPDEAVLVIYSEQLSQLDHA